MAAIVDLPSWFSGFSKAFKEPLKLAKKGNKGQ